MRTKKDRFILGVLAGAIVADYNSGRSIAPAVIDDAFDADEGIINAYDLDAGEMAREFIKYEYQTRLPNGPIVEQPDWFVIVKKEK